MATEMRESISVRTMDGHRRLVAGEARGMKLLAFLRDSSPATQRQRTLRCRVKRNVPAMRLHTSRYSRAQVDVQHPAQGLSLGVPRLDVGSTCFPTSVLK